MKTNFYFSVFLLFLPMITSCEKGKSPAKPGPEIIKGGKGGIHALVLLSKFGKKEINSRMFIKYASKTAPADTANYDEKWNTTAHFPYGPHVHFNNLLEGYYFVHAEAMNLGKPIAFDSAFQITEDWTDPDIYIQLK